MASVVPSTSIEYPESDGKPMGETDLHRIEMIRLIELLTRFYAGQRVYVTGDLLVYFEEGNPRKFVVPDVFVAKEIEPRDRRNYLVWVEGKPPDVIFEVTSETTKGRDTGSKPALYRRLRVPEYFLFDPTRDYLDPPLQGYRLTGSRYARLKPDSDGALISEQLGLRLRPADASLDLYCLDTRERLLTAEEALEYEAGAREAAEAEIARLREELRRREAK